MMDKNDLKLQNKNYDTALSLAAAVGNVKTAKIMVNKNPALPEIPSRHETMPLYLAALFAKPEMVRYLYGISKKMSGDYWSNDNRGWVLHKCVEAEIFGNHYHGLFISLFLSYIFTIFVVSLLVFVNVALNIVNDCPRLTIKKGLVTDVLLALAHKPHAFKQKKPHIIFRIINSGKKYMLLFFFFSFILTFNTKTHITLKPFPINEYRNNNLVEKTKQ
ncbi:putative ankyrin repeat-containing domain-containing protein [Helianthus annuus]|nr:putative ankyrin repeat-containing domain-containing protein [Helianthus annuus]